MSDEKEEPTIYYPYAGYREFVAHATQTLGTNPLDERSSRTKTRDEFYGKVSYEQAVELARMGDMKAAGSFKAKTLESANRFLSALPRLDPMYAVDGGMWIDINRYVRGEPEVWGDLRPEGSLDRPSLAIVCNIGVNGWVSSEDISKWGAEVAGVVIALQARGYPATFHIADKTCRGDHSYVFHFPLNPNGERLDMAYFAASLQTWFFRRVTFNWMENLDETIRRQYGILKGGGYGHSATLNEKDIQKIVGNPAHHIVLNRENTVGKKLEILATRILNGTEIGVA